jgi:hypothetical protein
MDEGIETFIRGLQRREEEGSLSMPHQMTTEEFQESMKVTHEETSSSASGLHYTLWKAIAEDDDLSATHAIMISLPFMHGFVCERWRKIIDCMLEKIQASETNSHYYADHMPLRGQFQYITLILLQLARDA